MYLVTGAGGFIGKHVLARLLERDQAVTALVRSASQERFAGMVAERFGAAGQRIQVVTGDIAQPRCGLSDADVAALRGKVKHLFHLAAIYDLAVDDATARVANVEGSRNATQLANALGCRMHYVSSIAVGGLYRGTFREDMFDEGQAQPNAYFQTKFDAEKVVRDECKVPLRIYRPGVVVGSSVTGEAEKIDGPYLGFKLLQRLRRALPEWMPLVGLEGGRLHLVPVDFVASALDHLAHQDGLDGKTFHLTDPTPMSFGDAANELARAAHAPRFTARIDSRILDLVPKSLFQMAGNLPAVRSAKAELLAGIGIPAESLQLLNWRTKFDTRETQAALAGSGISCPPLPSYAWKIWDYWERHLDPDLFKDRSLAGALSGKRVAITGASSGIGREVALKVAAVGGVPLLVARSADKLDQVVADIAAAGGTAHAFPCDLSDETAVGELAGRLLADGPVDVLINNAGRSIRRAVKHSYDRFHDYQRTIQLNYFGSLKLILGLLPAMRDAKSGHIINVSSIGVQTNIPRFSAYVASKAALDAFSRSIASEVVSDNVHITTVYMPLVKTPMIAPTKIYDAFPTIGPVEAADMVLAACLGKPKRVSTRLGLVGEGAYVVAPKLVDRVLNLGYRLFPENKPRDKDKPAEPPKPMSMEAVAFAHLLRGIHW